MRQAGFWEFGLNEAVLSAVRATPRPPRPDAFAQLARLSYGSSSGKALVGLALVLCLPLTVLETAAAQTDTAQLLFAIPSGLFFLLLLLAPALPARRAARALERGVPMDATVLRGGLRARGPLSATGWWRIDHPAGAFEEPFETDGPGAGDLRPGDRVRVLVDPDRRAALMLLDRIAGPDHPLD